MSKWNVAVYLRLSNEDNEKTESNSIVNQRVLIQSYIKKEKDMKIVDYYIDDGVSGTSFDRPEFQRMIKDITKGIVNTVVVKDLSRFGRNYVKAGDYLESIFPMYNVRFIAINDNLDNVKDPASYESIIVPIKNLMNDQYAKDISVKVRSILNVKKKNGQFIGAVAPYGYLKNPTNKHKFIVDKVASKIVKKIFKDAIQGKSIPAIVKELNEANILTPEMYKKINNQTNISKIEKKEWNARMIERILCNESYIGKISQSKKMRISHKMHKSINVDRNDWIVIDNHHESIISIDDFENVKKIIFAKELKINASGNYDLFAGYLKCQDCGSSFVKRKSKNITKYYCSKYYRNKACTNHRVDKDKLENIILKLINHQIAMIMDLEEKIEKFTSNNNVNYDYEILNDQLQKVEANIDKYKTLKNDLIFDLENKFIDSDTFSELTKDYSDTIEELEQNKSVLVEKMKKTEGNEIKNINWISNFKKYNNISTLNRNVLNNLIESINVNENGSLNIIFKYQNEFFLALDFINRG